MVFQGLYYNNKIDCFCFQVCVVPDDRLLANEVLVSDRLVKTGIGTSLIFGYDIQSIEFCGKLKLRFLAFLVARELQSSPDIPQKRHILVVIFL